MNNVKNTRKGIDSSMVEHTAHNRLVTGSNPVRSMNYVLCMKYNGFRYNLYIQRVSSPYKLILGVTGDRSYKNTYK